MGRKWLKSHIEVLKWGCIHFRFTKTFSKGTLKLFYGELLLLRFFITIPLRFRKESYYIKDYYYLSILSIIHYLHFFHSC